MGYNNLHDLINASSSTGKYFLSLPIEVQTSLHGHNDYIHTADELHRRANMIKNSERLCRMSDGKP